MISNISALDASVCFPPWSIRAVAAHQARTSFRDIPSEFGSWYSSMLLSPKGHPTLGPCRTTFEHRRPPNGTALCRSLTPSGSYSSTRAQGKRPLKYCTGNESRFSRKNGQIILDVSSSDRQLEHQFPTATSNCTISGGGKNEPGL